ncbi:immunoglobulin-like domain-containing protein [Leucobacter sp. HY1910]
MLGLTLTCALAMPLPGVLAVTGAPAAFAADETVPAPGAHYDMSHDGATLLDVSGNGRNAALTGLNDQDFVRAGVDDVLRMRGTGYATLPSGAITGDDNEFTVEFTVASTTAANHFGWVLGDGVGPWNSTKLGNHIFVSPVSAQGGYGGQALAAIRVKSGDSNGETRLPAGGGLNPGFSTLTLVGSGEALTLYRDGQQISTVQHRAALSSIVPGGDVLGYLGRSLYEGDPLLNADVTDMKLWDVALTPEQLAAAQPTAAEKAASTEALLSADLGTLILGKNAALDRVTHKLSLPTTVNGVALTWASSNTDVVAVSGNVTRPKTVDTAVTLTATTASGVSVALDVVVLAPRVTADLDAIALQSRTTEHLPLVATGAVDGSTITWASSDPDIVTPTDASYEAPAVGSADPFAGAGQVTRPAYGAGDQTVTLTATATQGDQTDARSFEITVAELSRTAPDAGYASAYFKSDSDERIYAAATQGNDFFSFTEVNGGKQIVDNSADTTGHRDPYILRSHDGDKYYMIATDLCIGCGGGWGAAQSDGSLKVNVWESTDLVNWSRTNGDDNGGIVVNQQLAGMTWAPEAYWDDELQSYVVFFASRLYDDEAHTTGRLHARMFTVLTRDFVTFTEPEQWQDTGYARIDSTVQKIGDTYYRFTKNEDSQGADGLVNGKDIFLEKSKVLTSTTSKSDWNADPNTTWQLVDTAMTNDITKNVGEGPQIIKLNEGDPANESGDGYAFLVDNYSDGGYKAFVTTGEAISSSSQSNRLSKQPGWTPRKDGLPKSPRHGAFVSVSQQVLEAMHEWRGVEAVASTTSSVASGRNVTTTVTAADGGSVAGTVTLRAVGAPALANADAQPWSQTVPLVDGVAIAEVPAGITSVQASYDGYADGLVATSEAAAVELTDAPGAGVDGGEGGNAGADEGGEGTTTPGTKPGTKPGTGTEATGTESQAGGAGSADAAKQGLAETGSGALPGVLALGALLAVAGIAVMGVRARRRAS